MTTTTRRGFFARLAGLLGAVVAAKALPDVLPAMQRWETPLIDPGSGVSIRFVKEFDLAHSLHPSRFDVFYGLPEEEHQRLERILADAAKSMADQVDRDLMAQWSDLDGASFKKGDIFTIEIPEKYRA